MKIDKKSIEILKKSANSPSLKMAHFFLMIVAFIVLVIVTLFQANDAITTMSYIVIVFGWTLIQTALLRHSLIQPLIKIVVQLAEKESKESSESN